MGDLKSSVTKKLIAILNESKEAELNGNASKAQKLYDKAIEYNAEEIAKAGGSYQDAVRHFEFASIKATGKRLMGPGGGSFR